MEHSATVHARLFENGSATLVKQSIVDYIFNSVAVSIVFGGHKNDPEYLDHVYDEASSMERQLQAHGFTLLPRVEKKAATVSRAQEIIREAVSLSPSRLVIFLNCHGESKTGDICLSDGELLLCDLVDIVRPCPQCLLMLPSCFSQKLFSVAMTSADSAMKGSSLQAIAAGNTPVCVATPCFRGCYSAMFAGKYSSKI